MHPARFAAFSYWYPNADVPALDAVDLAIDGGIVAVIGASGSGKSTLLRVFNGLVPHFHGGTVSGRADVFGHEVLLRATRLLARDVGFLFQDPELQSVYATVERDVAFGLENLGVPHAEMQLRVHDALARVGMTELRQRAVSTLSGGERQRLALAGVLALEPRMLVLDEPLSQLDSDGAAAFMHTVSALRTRGTTVVISEHRLRQVLPRADRVLAITRGRMSDAVAGEDRSSASPPPRIAVHPSAQRSTAAEWHLHHVTAGIGRTPIVAGANLSGGGDVVVLTGPNGSGKTTLLRTLAGLLAPLSGRIERPSGRVAYLPQNPTALLHRPTVRDEIEWTLRHAATHESLQVEAALDAFGLRTVADRYPRDLSTGQRQRVALAAVLVGGPRLALLDEPTRGMDATARAALIHAVEGMRAGGGSVVMATHDRELAAAVADRIIHVEGGAIRAARTLEAAPA